MFRSTGQFDKLLDKATSNLIMEPDWGSIMQICDQIRQNDVQPKYALNGLKKRLQSTNPHTQLYALLLLESLVKNCGSGVHEELTTPQFCEALHELSKTPHENVRSKLLELIQVWSFVFRKNPKHGALKDLMNQMKAEGFKFPALRESDAMFSTDTAPEWADGDTCHRCRVVFSLIVRKHHCRACGQVFCNQCSQKLSTLPKFGIEREVRVCDGCYDQINKPSAASKSATDKSESDLPPEYLNSSLAQQNQTPPRKSEEELQEEEELQLALALSQSEAEAKEKEKNRMSNSTIHTPTFKVTPEARVIEEEHNNPELARYLDRTYWESINQSEAVDSGRPTSPSAPATAPASAPATAPALIIAEPKQRARENGVGDSDLEEFISTLKSQVEIFINRMKSNSSRGRSIANDSSVQTLFMNITAMHSRLLRYIQQHDDSRLHYERLQDKLTQVKDERAALDALRDEHRERLRREAEEAERLRQMQMAQKLEIMRKKKQEYLQYQRQLALQRVQEQEREMQMRQEQQKQQYLMGPQYGGFIGSPVHAQQFAPNAGIPANYQYRPPMMQAVMSAQQPQTAPQIGQPIGLPQGPQPPQSAPGMTHPGQLGPPPGFGPMPQTMSQPNQPSVAAPQLQGPPGPHMIMQPGMPPQGMPHFTQHAAGPQPVMPMAKQGMPQMPGMAPQSGVPMGSGPQPRMPLQNPGVPQPNPGLPQPNPGMPHHMARPGGGMIPPNMPPQNPNIPQMGNQSQVMPPHQYPQPGAPPASPQVQQPPPPQQPQEPSQPNGDAQTAELISFD